ncbi:alpha/beta hydrolase [Streptomyces aidingensis]|uniref:Alpha/beta hydrolase n=1 Tax=Streptomyces aidingensis TaxID=910347 RepID=A0A1I1JAB0_9ACTN|nr:alpha/beta hydrolase [Streptomyces aidingensis]SFC45539.1 hypothetical protein SAMN05421773_103343 [Streptomyces aidingensis]
MAKIVGVHGIGQQYRGPYELTSAWHDALRDGLSAAGHDSLAAALERRDLEIAFFGGLFRPERAVAGGEREDELPSGAERELLEKLYRAAVARDPALGPRAVGPGRAAVQVMLRTLLRSRWFPAVAERAFVGNLRQVTRFLTDQDTKEQVLERLDGEIGEDTVALIGHSLGSVVTYEYLCRSPSPVRLYLTLGSPLGIPGLIFDRLTPRPEEGRGAWPGTVERWVNVADGDDIVALRKDLAALFPGRSPGRRVEDRLVDNGDQPHAITRYLNARQTGGALAGLLGGPA